MTQILIDRIYLRNSNHYFMKDLHNNVFVEIWQVYSDDGHTYEYEFSIPMHKSYLNDTQYGRTLSEVRDQIIKQTKSSGYVILTKSEYERYYGLI